MINQTQIVGKKYDLGNRIIYNTKILKSDLFDYNDAYILVAFKQDTPFTRRITAIDGTPADDAKDLNLFMRLYNLLDSSNYYETTGSSWFYSTDE